MMLIRLGRKKWHSKDEGYNLFAELGIDGYEKKCSENLETLNQQV